MLHVWQGRSPESHFTEGNNKDSKKKEHRRGNDDMSRYGKSSKSSKYDISRIKMRMKKTFTALEENIDEIGDGESNLTSSYR